MSEVNTNEKPKQEQSSLAPISKEKRIMGWGSNTMLWLGGCISIGTLAQGSAQVEAGLNLLQLFLAVAIGSLILVVGIALVVYYMTFGVFYDQESFLVTTFGKRSIVYRYGQITGQQLYNASGNLLIELYMDDGRTVQLQAGMTGVYPFLDKAFAKWLEQTGRRQEECDFYKPDQHCWFPPMGG